MLILPRTLVGVSRGDAFQSQVTNLARNRWIALCREPGSGCSLAGPDGLLVLGGELGPKSGLCAPLCCGAAPHPTWELRQLPRGARGHRCR